MYDPEKLCNAHLIKNKFSDIIREYNLNPSEESSE